MAQRKRKPFVAEKSALEELWPPKWFVSYADLATLLMTFFIVLATMLALKIPLYALADKQAQAVLESEYDTLEEIKRLTEQELKVLENVNQLDEGQVRYIVELRKLKQFAEEIREYIKNRNLEKVIRVKETDYKITIEPTSSFLFKKGESTLKPETKEFLAQIAEFLNEYSSLVRIAGHTDNVPVRWSRYHSNWELSIARANAIVRYLVEERGVNPQRLFAIGYGAQRPIAPNGTPQGRAQNRRVVVEIMPEFIQDLPERFMVAEQKGYSVGLE